MHERKAELSADLFLKGQMGNSTFRTASRAKPEPLLLQDKELLLQVLQFTALLIEHSFTRHLYSSMEHLTTLLSSSDMTVVLGVLNLLYVFRSVPVSVSTKPEAHLRLVSGQCAPAVCYMWCGCWCEI